MYFTGPESTPGANPSFSVIGTHTYTTTGTFQISVHVQDAGGQTVAAQTSITVIAPGNLVVQGIQPISAPEGWTSDFYDLEVASFTDQPWSGGTGATINWGDGCIFPGEASWNSGTGQVYNAVNGYIHNYSEVGAYPITITINDGQGTTATVYDVALIQEDALLPPSGQQTFQGAFSISRQVIPLTCP